MAAGDLTIVTANSGAGSSLTGFASKRVQVGETFTGVQPAYYDTASKKYKLCIATDSSKYKASGIIMGAGVDGDFLELVTAGLIKPGATLSKGRRYVVSSASGMIMLDTSIASGDYVMDLGIAHSTSELLIRLYDHEIQV